MPDVDGPGNNMPFSHKIVSSSNEIVLSIYLLLNLKQDCSFDSTSDSRQLCSVVFLITGKVYGNVRFFRLWAFIYPHSRSKIPLCHWLFSAGQ